MLVPVALMAVISLERCITPNVTKHGQQHDQGRDIVEQIGGDVEQVFRHDGGRNLVAKNVSQQFEQA